MNNIIEKQKSFQDRIKDRIKDSIGELMTDEELSKIVSRATEDIFFKPTEVKDRYHTKTEPPFIYGLIKELLQSEVNKATKEYFLRNKDLLSEQINVIVSDGIGNAVLKSLTRVFQQDIFDLEMRFQNSINNLVK